MVSADSSLPRLPKGSTIAWLIVGFIGLAFLIYGASLKNGFVRIDDGLLIYENPAVLHINPGTIKTIFTTYDPELYIPLTLFTYQIDYAIGGIHAFIYHFGNLLWHILNALLVVWLGFLLSRKQWAALLMGLLFLVHPLNTEAVAWAAARKDVLSTFFFLGSLIAYLYYLDADGDRSRTRKLYSVSLSLFALGLLAKVMILTLPIVLLLIDDLRGRTWNRRMLLEKIPYFVLTILFGIVALFGKRALLSTVSPTDELLIALKSTVFYIQKLILPFGFSPLYPYTDPITLSSSAFSIPILLLVAAIVGGFLIRRRTRVPFFVVAFYLITLAPTFTNLIKGDVFLGSDRYAYVPAIGLFFGLTFALFHWVESNERARLSLVQGISVVACVFFALLAYGQSLVWNSSETLFTHILTIYPDSYAAHNNLANAYRRDGRYKDAETQLKAALSSKDLPKIHANLGALYAKAQQYSDAEAQFQSALTEDPKSQEALLGLANLYFDEGETDKAMTAYGDTIAAWPDDALAYVNRGILKAKSGDARGAVEDQQAAIKIEPNQEQAHYNLALAYEDLSQPEHAVQEYEAAIALQPWDTSARINVGILYAAEGQKEASRRQFQAILQYDPQNKAALQALEQLQ